MEGSDDKAPNIDRLVSDWPVNAASVGVVRLGVPGRDSPLEEDPLKGDSIKNDREETEVVEKTGDLSEVFSWASITKLLVALSVLVAVEEGTVSLDEPAGPPHSTVRHLLAHASGLGFEGALLSMPGRRRIYSNTGFEVLAEHLSEKAKMPFVRYLTDGVLGPLGMTRTVLSPGSSPASGAVGPLSDLLILGSELLAPNLLAPETFAEAVKVAYPGLSGVVPGIGRFDPCDWGLGFELKGTKSPHWTAHGNSPATFGHFGGSGSFLWVDPLAKVACVGLADRPFGPWALEAWPVVGQAALEKWSRRS